MVQLDWCVGEVLGTLDSLGLAENTLVVFSSDNGPVLDDGYHDQANELLGDHRPAGVYRAGKYSKFEGGTRVPFLARWPARIPAGTVSEALFGQIDLPASLTAMVGAELRDDTFLDSTDELDTLLGEDAVGRDHLVHEARGGNALRLGPWKYVSPGRTRDGLGPWKNVPIHDQGALYNLVEDEGEAEDLGGANTEKLRRARGLLQKIMDPKSGQTSSE